MHIRQILYNILIQEKYQMQPMDKQWHMTAHGYRYFAEKFAEELYKTKIIGHIASGTGADAFILDNGNVMKITDYPQDAYSANWMVTNNINHPRLAEVYDVFQINLNGREPIYGIVMEQLTDICGMSEDEEYEIGKYIEEDLHRDNIYPTNDLHRCNIGRNKHGEWVMADINLMGNNRDNNITKQVDGTGIKMDYSQQH